MDHLPLTTTYKVNWYRTPGDCRCAAVSAPLPSSSRSLVAACDIHLGTLVTLTSLGTRHSHLRRPLSTRLQHANAPTSLSNPILLLLYNSASPGPAKRPRSTYSLGLGCCPRVPPSSSFHPKLARERRLRRPSRPPRISIPKRGFPPQLPATPIPPLRPLSPPLPPPWIPTMTCCRTCPATTTFCRMTATTTLVMMVRLPYLHFHVIAPYLGVTDADAPQASISKRNPTKRTFPVRPTSAPRRKYPTRLPTKSSSHPTSRSSRMISWMRST